MAGLQAVFFENWHYAHRASPSGAAYFPPCPEPPLAWVQVLSSGPDREVYPIHELFVSAIAAADLRVWIVTPYFVPDEALVVALRLAAHRGVDVRLIVPARGDSRVVDAAMRSYYDELTAAGVRLFEYGPALIHAKTLVVDNELAVVSTANLDNRSFRLNFEAAVAIHGARFAEELALQFAHDLADAREVAADRQCRLSTGRRLAEATARLFSPVL